LVKYSKLGLTGWLVVALLAAGLIWGIWKSKRPVPAL
jgi:cytochrome b